MEQGLPFNSGRVLARFSCGAASAVATKLACEKYPGILIYYNETGSHHPDNERFLKECENWFGVKIQDLRNPKWKDHFEVCESRRFISSPSGAPCTGELKRMPGEKVWELGDIEIFGYTSDEKDRLDQWKEDNPEKRIECPLIDRGITKDECFDMVRAAGIELPMMYKLGFRNNNCIACAKVRDSPDYWKRTRKHFPAEFDRMARLERELGFALIRRGKEKRPVYLDELEEGDPKGVDPKISCGLFCMVEETDDSISNDKQSQTANGE